MLTALFMPEIHAPYLQVYTELESRMSAEPAPLLIARKPS
jgi:hypothetical protein